MNEPVENLGKVSVTVINDEHDPSTAYERLTIVRDYDKGDFAVRGSYISIKDVPIGTLLSDETYWCPLTPTITIEELKVKLGF